MFTIYIVGPDDTIVGLTNAGHLQSLTTTVIGEVKERATPIDQVEGDWQML